MEIFIVLVFVLGYAAITMEHNFKVDKLIPALLMMVLAWAGVSIGMNGFTEWFDSVNQRVFSIVGLDSLAKGELFQNTLLHHLGTTSEILVFLIGAMTIVEIIDHFNGFSTIKTFVHTHKKRKLLWVIACLAFILSSIIDNLTATIVLITILRKFLENQEDRMWFAGIIIIAANAGGAWSPIGDVTTTMLWMGNKVTAAKLIEYLVLPSILCLVVPVLIASFMKPFKGTFEMPNDEDESNPNSKLMFYLGLIMIISVPIIKETLNLPPYIGMMLALSVVALFAEVINQKQHKLALADGSEVITGFESPVIKAMSRIEMPSILFFLGILMTVAALESLGLIFNFGESVQEVMPRDVFIVLLGVGSAIIDNVPLVAASMGMFDAPIDSHIWHFIAFSAGTGGSMLIIGSAAGVVAMGMERIPFFWYVKKISWLALIGFLVGCGQILLEAALFNPS